MQCHYFGVLCTISCETGSLNWNGQISLNKFKTLKLGEVQAHSQLNTVGVLEEVLLAKWNGLPIVSLKAACVAVWLDGSTAWSDSLTWPSTESICMWKGFLERTTRLLLTPTSITKATSPPWKRNSKMNKSSIPVLIFFSYFFFFKELHISTVRKKKGWLNGHRRSLGLWASITNTWS